MYLALFLAVLLGINILAVNAQTSYTPYTCGIGGSTLTACNYAATHLSYCVGSYAPPGSTTLTGTAGYDSCYCNQVMLNSFFDCESEQRLCYKNNAVFGQNEISIWHSYCDKRIAFTPTTPVLSTIDSGFCGTVSDACGLVSAWRTKCSSSYSASSTLLASCLCFTSVLPLDYTCSYLGNVSCSARPATLTNMLPYTLCPSVASAYYTGINSVASVPASTTASSSSSLSSVSMSGSGSSYASSTITTRPALPGSSTATTTPQSTSSSASSANSLRIPRTYIVQLAGSVAFWIAVALIQ